MRPHRPGMRTDHISFMRDARGALRTIRLVVISLAVVGGAFWIYQARFEPIPPVETLTEVPIEHRGFLEGDADESDGSITVDNVKVSGTGRAGITLLDDHQRKRIHINYTEPRQIDEEGLRFHVEQPAITYYMPDGERAEIHAKTGEITSRAPGTMELVQGALHGDVLIILDRTTDAWRDAHPGEFGMPTPQERLVRIWLDEVTFDLQLGWLSSGSAFRMESAEAVMEGTGLKTQWNTTTGEVDRLEVQVAKKLTLKDQNQFGINLDVDSNVLETSNVEKSNRDEPDVEQEASHETETTEVAQQWSVEVIEDKIIIPLPRDSDAPQQIATYWAQFNDDVRVRQEPTGKKQLHADTLQVIFDMSTDFSSGDDAEGQPDPSGEKPVSNDQTRQKEEDRYEMFWSGPLVVQRVTDVASLAAESPELQKAIVSLDQCHLIEEGTHPDQERPKRIRMVAVGSPVVLSDGTGRAASAQFLHDVASECSQFYGNDLHTIQMSFSKEQSLSATDRVLLEPHNRQIAMFGAVQVHYDGADVHAEEIEVDLMHPPIPGRSSKLMDLCNELRCRHDVQLQRDGRDELRGDTLRLELRRDAHGDNIPHHAHVRDHVALRQGSRTIHASRYLDVVFGDLPRDESDVPSREFPLIRSLESDGGVRIADSERGMNIKGEFLECEFDEKENIEYGHIVGTPDEMAFVQMGEFGVEGSEVFFDDRRQWAHVPSAGSARFVMEEDLDGRRYEKPTPIDVTWNEEMTLDGTSNTLVFQGMPVAVSENVTLDCVDSLNITLEDVPDEPMQGTQQASTGPGNMWFLKPFQKEAEQLSQVFGRRESTSSRQQIQTLRKKATYIVADQDATLQSLEEYVVGEARRRVRNSMTIHGPRLDFDLRTRLMGVRGAGYFLYEDYSKVQERLQPARRSPRSGLFDDLSGGGLSQTKIAWDSQMTYSSEQSVAHFSSRNAPVHMDHFFGNRVIMPQQQLDELQVDPDELEALLSQVNGGNVSLDCRQLFVKFCSSPSGSRSRQGQMNAEQVCEFHADGDVILVDESRFYVRAGRIDFLGEENLLEIYGAPGEDAYFIRYQTGSQRREELKSPKIYYDLVTGEIQTPGLRSRSGGL